MVTETDIIELTYHRNVSAELSHSPKIIVEDRSIVNNPEDDETKVFFMKNAHRIHIAKSLYYLSLHLKSQIDILTKLKHNNQTIQLP